MVQGKYLLTKSTQTIGILRREGLALPRVVMKVTVSVTGIGGRGVKNCRR